MCKDPYRNVASIGVDVHYKFSTVAFAAGPKRILRRERLEHRDREALRARLAQWPKDAGIFLEASFGWGWLTDEMKAVGLGPRLANCRKLAAMRKARSVAKTNNKDAELLSELSDERSNWWEVWLAPPAVRDQRERMRFRADLVALQTQCKNRIHAVFHRHGIFHDFSDLFGAAGREFLAELCRHGQDDQGGSLPPGALLALRGHLRLLDHVRGHLADVARRLRKELEHNPLTKRLVTIPGIGLILSHVISAEIGEIGRFHGERRLASYSLLAPNVSETGEADASRAPIGRHLGHCGNRVLKWSFIEAAHGAVHKGGRWRAYYDRVTDGGKKDRNRGYIKVARKLVQVVYAVWKRAVEYREDPPPRGGLRRSQREAEVVRQRKTFRTALSKKMSARQSDKRCADPPQPKPPPADGKPAGTAAVRTSRIDKKNHRASGSGRSSRRK
jgi:transposase